MLLNAYAGGVVVLVPSVMSGIEGANILCAGLRNEAELSSSVV